MRDTKCMKDEKICAAEDNLWKVIVSPPIKRKIFHWCVLNTIWKDSCDAFSGIYVLERLVLEFKALYKYVRTNSDSDEQYIS